MIYCALFFCFVLFLTKPKTQMVTKTQFLTKLKTQIVAKFKELSSNKTQSLSSQMT